MILNSILKRESEYLRRMLYIYIDVYMHIYVFMYVNLSIHVYRMEEGG
jgi:hypothetical protein